MRKLLLIAFVILISLGGYSQEIQTDSVKTEPKSKVGLFTDSIDGHLDMSKWLLSASGFFPMAYIVTEPALGSFGLVAMPIFIEPNKPKKEGEYAPPNLTVGAAGYTLNDTWSVGAIRIVHNQKYGIKYRYGAAYANINMDFYQHIYTPNLPVPIDKEVKFSFNFSTVPIYLNFLKELGDSHFFIGGEYIFVKTKIKPIIDEAKRPLLSEIIKDKDYDSKIGTAGLLLQYDTRDNLFTANKGFYAELDLRVSDSWSGSDYDFQNAHFIMFKYFQFTNNWVSGFRGDFEFLFGDDSPFYVHPVINLRGVSMGRYRGLQGYTIETEQRYDFNLRWSGVAFGGLGKVTDDKISFDEAALVHNYGVGFRYLISRVFGIRMGMDFAMSGDSNGNSDWGYYITFGSAWKR